jgi:hypothetical protein
MATAAVSVALPFVGTFVGAFACTLAFLCGEGFAACAALVMAVYCAAEFVSGVDPA